MFHKILISAFSCLPNRGSEPGIGWNWAIEAAKSQEVYVLTRTKCKAKIEKELSVRPIKNLNFIYCDSSVSLRKISIYLEYIYWQYSAYKYLKSKDLTSYDYLFHITFGNIFLPIWTHKLEIPFIWGPIGGGEKIPKSLYKDFSLKDKIPHILKDILISTIKYNPFVMNVAKRATYIISRTIETKDIFPPSIHNKIGIKLETAMNINTFINNKDINSESINNKCVNLIYTGRLVALKNVRLIIDSIAKLIDDFPGIIVNIVGDGNLRKQLEMMVNKYEMDDKFKFYGHVSWEKSKELVSKSDIYLFPSLKECGAWSLMEAMSLGKPIICLKRSGMDIITDDKCAIKIDANYYSDMVNDFADAIKKLLFDPHLRELLGENARRRITTEFSWDCIAQYIYDLLNRLDNAAKNNIDIE